MEGYVRMSDLNTGEGLFGHQLDKNYRRLGYVEYNKTANDHWFLVGHQKAFILILPYNTKLYSTALFFGDFPSCMAGDTGNTVLWNTSYERSESLSPAYLSSSRFVNNIYAPRYAKNYRHIEDNPVGITRSLFDSFRTVPYPDIISGGIQATDIYLEEYLTYVSPDKTLHIRGLQPGLMRVRQFLSGITDGSEVPSPNSDVWLKVSIDDNAGGDSDYIINATAWEG